MKASNEWASRPADESFGSLADLHSAAVKQRERATTLDLVTDEMRATVLNGAVQLNGTPLTHWAFGQLARIAGGPAEYLRSLPAPIASAAINHGLVNLEEGRDPQTRALVDSNGSETVRALCSTTYTRLYNSDVTSRLVQLADARPEWQPAPAAIDGKRGLYLGDQDMFAFLVDNDRRIFEKGPAGGLGRGFFTWNSEVGSASFGICTFLYEFVCGNHRVWGASAIRELRMRHVGSADIRALTAFDAEFIKYADSSAESENLLIDQARHFQIAGTKDEVLDKVFGLRIPTLSRKVLVESFDAAEKHADWYGDPRTAWGLTGGITEVSQARAYTNVRNDLDRAAGKVLDMAFA